VCCVVIAFSFTNFSTDSELAPLTYDLSSDFNDNLGHVIELISSFDKDITYLANKLKGAEHFILS